jgi:hypothetical protein
MPDIIAYVANVAMMNIEVNNELEDWPVHCQPP